MRWWSTKQQDGCRAKFIFALRVLSKPDSTLG